MRSRIIQTDNSEPHSEPHAADEPPNGHPRHHLAARVGGWSARHWKTAVFGWISFVAASYYIGSTVGTTYLEASESNVGEARTADKIIEAGFPNHSDEQGEMVLIQHPTLTADEPAFRAVIVDVETALDGFPKVRKLNSPLDAGHADLISDDGHSAMVTFSPKGDYDEAVTYIQTIELAMDRIGERAPRLLRRRAG